ncbi:hypothetical protein HCC18_16795 [Listeria booriae]|uniref:phospholipase D family protein n=1 Tax=Listeria booriae TaxID=1552123 RepID=UPI001628F23B|nr:phospholipase D family protein [Listeria booriae]MBC2318505.1 hypothetical protein [Listeria booriae]MCD2205556.1 phospholipase D family protein [Listeria booriae]
MAKAKIITQGLNKEQNHLNLLRTLLKDGSLNKFIFSTAYLREAAVEMLSAELGSVAEKIDFFVGIRNGVTSYQGLSKLLTLGINLYVIDTGVTSSIFHSKSFTARSDTLAVSVVGSANFTSAGLMRNVETSVILELDLTEPSDVLYMESLESDFHKLATNYGENVVKIVDISNIEDLLKEGRIIDENSETLIPTIGNNKMNKIIVPKMELELEVPISKSLDTLERTNKKTIIISEGPLILEEIWRSKELVRRDLNIPTQGSNTNATGSMLLKKGSYKINQQSYFRNIVFTNLKWINKDSTKSYFEFAVAKFHFIIDGIEYGWHELNIKHDTRKNTITYRQKQPMTHLMWGTAKDLICNEALLSKELRMYSIDSRVDEFLIEIA